MQARNKETSKGKSRLSKPTQEALKGKRVSVIEDYGREKYSKQMYVKIYKGYDMLENMTVVRPYIQKKYDLNINTFELLLKLMGMGLFTQDDFLAIPRDFKYNRWRHMLNSGYIALVMPDKNKRKHVYSLNEFGKKIIIEFYEYLSGEKQMDLDETNPFINDKTKKSWDKKRLELIKRLRDSPIPDHKKSLFVKK